MCTSAWHLVSFTIQPLIQRQNGAVQHLGSIRDVAPWSEFQGRMADAVAAGDKNHAHSREQCRILRILACSARHVEEGEPG